MSMESRSTKSRRRKPPDVFPHLLTRALQNIGKNDISCLLELFNADGTMAAEETIDLGPEASVVDFFNDLVLAGGASLQGGEPAFKGRGAFTCDAPVVAVAVNQDFANGGFPTDRITIKGVN